MRFYMKDNQLWLDAKDYKGDFRCKLFFNDYFGVFEEKTKNEFLYAGKEASTLSQVISRLIFYETDIDDEVYYYYIKLRIKEDKEQIIAQKELNIKKEKEEALKEWQNKCKYGCFPCKHLVKCNDDLVCDIDMNKPLPTKTEPDVINGQHYLFVRSAYPNKHCYYRVKENENEKSII